MGRSGDSAESRAFLAVIADVQGSRDIPDRAAFQRRRLGTLRRLNRALARERLPAGFRITAGDEIQGLLADPADLVDVTRELADELHPVRRVFGAGWGRLTTDLVDDVAALDGPCFHAARRGVVEAARRGAMGAGRGLRRCRGRGRVGLRGYEPLTRGESLVGVRADRRGVPWSVSARASFNRAGIHVDERNLDPPVGRANHVDSRRDWWSGAVGVAYAAHRWRLDVGAGVDRRVNRQAWTARGLIDEVFSPNTPAEYAGEESLTLFSLFGEGEAELGGGWSAALGARVWSAGGVHVAPRARLGHRVSDPLALEVALNRRHQWDAQLEEPVEGSVTAPLFLLEEPRIADVAAFSARLEPDGLPGGARGTFHSRAFWKEYRERPVLPERPPGDGRPETAGPDFPVFDRIRGRGTGATLGGRLAFPGGTLVQGSYTFQRVFEQIGGREYPTAWDVPHTVVLFGSMPLGALDAQRRLPRP